MESVYSANNNNDLIRYDIKYWVTNIYISDNLDIVDHKGNDSVSMATGDIR